MTQSSLQTRCPKCDTRFRVTDEQLSIAKGKVRCGNCMDVFNAIDHQMVPPAPTKPASEPPITGKSLDSGESASGFSADDDFVFADNPEEDAAEGKYTGTNLTFSDDELSDSFRTVHERPEMVADESQQADNDVDESWAEAMLSEDPEPRPAIKPAARPDAEPLPPEPAAKRTEEPLDTTTKAPLSPQATDDEPLNTRHPYHDLRREPVSVGGGSGGRLRSFLWAVVVLALLGMLVAQVVWFQFDRLSAIPELRPFYEQGCELAGCELKPLIDVDAIQSRKLVVRTDPEDRTRLMVEAVIINRAAFEQPFPAIALTFSNLNGDVVAQSMFTPDEYIAGEGRELNAMPTEAPVRIAIRIRDPGRDAVNYNIAFRAHSP
ncbi:DUF3426 domain-containing protein [Marinobacter sp.]|uniref:DUF3426 domain-containing protein n=1 Tax=Marinobacter sp. TaxID=50741 RepID=UPI0034A49A6A